MLLALTPPSVLPANSSPTVIPQHSYFPQPVAPSGAIDSYELSVFATSFFRTLKDPVLREQAEEMMEVM